MTLRVDKAASLVYDLYVKAMADTYTQSDLDNYGNAVAWFEKNYRRNWREYCPELKNETKVGR